LYVT